MGRACNIWGIWVGKKERNHYEDLDVGGRIILKRILEKEDGGL
jgi:hypothetical protein